LISLRRPLLLGHRGARLAAPENTLAAFELALAHGCDGFEFDVRQTRDSRAILCHDPRWLGKTIARSSYEKLCRSAALPLLEEVIGRFAGRAYLDIELKVPALEQQLTSVLARNINCESLVVSSFLPEVLLAMRRALPDIRLGYIADKSSHLSRWKTLPCEIVIAHFKLAKPELVECVHAAGKQFFVWTVNERAAMLRFASMGVDAIISDDTELLGRVLGSRR
jgi:glycerophosphoryl diester phosphodiesterase